MSRNFCRNTACLIIASFLISPFLTVCKAQIVEKQNAISLELGKTGLIYNVTYDHKFKSSALGWRCAIGTNLAKHLTAFTGGTGCYYLIGKKNNRFEIGADLNYLSVSEVSDDQKGFAFVYPDYSINTYNINLNLGYRHYTEKTMFRIGLSPGLIKEGFLPGGYISYGLLF